MAIFETRLSSIKQLTDALLGFADTFSFVIRNESEVNSNVVNLINDLSPFRLSMEMVGEWPGTKLLCDKACLYKFILNGESASILDLHEDNLFKWIHPDLPEDLSFYRHGLPIFVSITHEGDAYFEVDINDVKEMKERKLI